jgi:hypothetical protein
VDGQSHTKNKKSLWTKFSENEGSQNLFGFQPIPLLINRLFNGAT